MKYFFSILLFAFYFTSNAQIPSYVPTSGLVGYWPFNGNANDESVNGFILSNYFVEYTNDNQRGRVAKFNGNAWLEGDTSIFRSLTPITISFWAKSTSSYSMDVIGQNCANDCGDDIRVQLNAAQCGYTALSFKSPAFFASAPATTSDSIWHLYTIVLGDNNNYSYSNFKFFIDGFFVAIGPTQCSHNWGGWTYNPNKNYPLTIGKGAPLGSYFKGYLDDIAIYNRALSTTEITQLYNNSFTPLPPTTPEDTTSNVGIGTANPKRKLHINDVMRLEPRNTAPINPAKGDIYFDGVLNKLRVYDGTVWQNCW
jgi:hypothetical protein